MPRIRIRLAARPLWMYRVLMAWRQHRVGAWLGDDASESGCMVQIVQFHQLELSISLAENLELDRSMAFGTAPDTIHGTARDSHYARDRLCMGGAGGKSGSGHLACLPSLSHTPSFRRSPPSHGHNLLDPCLDEVSLLRGVPQSRPFSDIALLQVFGVNGDHLAQSRHGGRRTIMGGNWARFRTNKMHTSTWLRRAWAEVGAGADGESHLERFVLRGRRRRVLAFGQLNHLDNLRR